MNARYVYCIIPSAGVNTAATEAPTTSMFGGDPDFFLPPEVGNHRPRRQRPPRRCRSNGSSSGSSSDSGSGSSSRGDSGSGRSGSKSGSESDSEGDDGNVDADCRHVSRDSGGVLVPSTEMGSRNSCSSRSSNNCSTIIETGSRTGSIEEEEEENTGLTWIGGQVPSPLFASQRAWCVGGGPTLNLTAMRAAAGHLEGEHDFSTFRGPDCHVRERSLSSCHGSGMSVGLVCVCVFFVVVVRFLMLASFCSCLLNRPNDMPSQLTDIFSSSPSSFVRRTAPSNESIPFLWKCHHSILR